MHGIPAADNHFLRLGRIRWLSEGCPGRDKRLRWPISVRTRRRGGFLSLRSVRPVRKCEPQFQIAQSPPDAFQCVLVLGREGKDTLELPESVQDLATERNVPQYVPRR